MAGAWRAIGSAAFSRWRGRLATLTTRRVESRGSSAQPSVRSEIVSQEDEFVILGSDGLWGVVQNEDAVRLARAELATYDNDAEMASQKLIEVALKRHCDDNVSDRGRQSQRGRDWRAAGAKGAAKAGAGEAIDRRARGAAARHGEHVADDRVDFVVGLRLARPFWRGHGAVERQQP